MNLFASTRSGLAGQYLIIMSRPSLRRFLNRLLGIPLDSQTEVLKSFFKRMQANVRRAIQAGKFRDKIRQLTDITSE